MARRVGYWFVCWLVCAGCRALDPASGDLARARIGDVVEPRTVRSDARNLEPIADILRENAGLVVQQDGLFGAQDLTWRFDGDREAFELNDELGRHIGEPGRSGFGPLADAAELSRELEALEESLGAFTLGGGGGSCGLDAPGGYRGDPACTPSDDEPDPDPDPPGGGFSGGASGLLDLGDFFFNGIVDGLSLTSEGVDRPFEVQWDARSIDLDHPILRVETNFRFDVRRGWLGRALFEKMEATAGYAHLVNLQVCSLADDPTSPICRDGVTFFSGYRELTAPRFGPDAVAPSLGLSFDSCTEPHSVEVDVDAGLRCPLLLRPLLALLPPILLDVVQGIGFPGFLCRRIATSAEREIESQLCGASGSLEQLVAVALDPITFRLTLRQALFATGADINEDGTLSPPEVGQAIQELAGIPGGAILARGDTLDRVFVSPVAFANVRGPDGPTCVPMLGEDAALTDAAVVAVARGADVFVTGATLDFRRVKADCASRGPSSSVLCGLCSLAPSLCSEGVLVDQTFIGAPAVCSSSGSGGDDGGVIDGDAGTGDLLPPIRIEPSPNVAQILSGAALFGETIRAFFRRPLPPDARYVASSASLEAGQPVARFRFIVDPDQDQVDAATDNCPQTPNHDQENTDGDGFGDACDRCPGVPNALTSSEAAEFGDIDGDGIPNGCDCDADGDSCVEARFELGPDGVARACTPPPGATFDGLPERLFGGLPSGDFDGDGIPNQCDEDLDGDGVANEDDNCPLGRGGDVFVVGLDDDPDQTDSGGSRAGDLCDPLCTGPSGGIACAGPGEPGGGAPGSGIFFPGAPGRFECVGRLCRVGALTDCLSGGQADECGNFSASLRFVDRWGGRQGVVNAPDLGLDAPLDARVVQLARDFDGDGLGELIVTSHRASGCAFGPNEPFRDCARTSAGQVLLLGTRSGTVLSRLVGAQSGAFFGRGVAAAGDIVAVGAPGEAQHGAVHLYDLSSGSPTWVQTIWGTGADALGTDVAVVEAAWPPRFVAGAPGAGQGDGALVWIDALDGEVGRVAAPVRGGRLSRVEVVDGRIVAGLPSVEASSGAILIFGLDGALLGEIRGTPGARLGASVVGLGETLAVGAPGAFGGEGAVYLYAADTQPIAIWRDVGRGVGAQLSRVETADAVQLWVGLTIEGHPYTSVWDLP